MCAGRGQTEARCRGPPSVDAAHGKAAAAHKDKTLGHSEATPSRQGRAITARPRHRSTAATSRHGRKPLERGCPANRPPALARPPTGRAKPNVLGSGSTASGGPGRNVLAYVPGHSMVAYVPGRRVLAYVPGRRVLAYVPGHSMVAYVPDRSARSWAPDRSSPASASRPGTLSPAARRRSRAAATNASNSRRHAGTVDATSSGWD